MRSLAILLTVILLARVEPVAAASAAGEFAIRGVGGADCSRFVAAAEKDRAMVAAFRSWLEGYITAVNRYRADTFDVAPWEKTSLLLTLVFAHCQNNPDQPLYAVAHELVVLLGTQRLRRRSEIVALEGSEPPRRIYREVLRQAQQALIARGLLQGKADGLYGPKTRAAFEAFQKQAGLKVTGVPDQETLYRLLLEPVIQGPPTTGEPKPGG